MPTYEFRCPEGHDFEKFYRTISGAESQATCPQCGALAERIMSATGFAFKGSGFYLTDYGKDAHRKKGPADAKPDAGKGDSSGSSSPSSASESGGGSSDSSTGSGSSSGSSSGGDAKAAPKADAKPAESKPAPAAPKPSSGE